jgi:hypothetical protein
MYAKTKSRLGLGPLSSGSQSTSSGTSLSKTQSDITDRLSIFKKPRLAPLSTTSNRLYNGLGGSEKKENFVAFPNRLGQPKDLKSKFKIDKLKSKRSETTEKAKSLEVSLSTEDKEILELEMDIDC